jgi:polyvinyl alcohol dehydrogenase (cytochrome)
VSHRFELLALALVALLSALPARAAEWPMYAGGPRRLFFNPAETTITPANVGALKTKWTFGTGAIITGSPSVVTLDLPGEGATAVAFIASWDDNLYALRTRDGTELWHRALAAQPGASFPDAASVDVETVDGRRQVFAAGGETVYAIDAITGQEIWHFDAGTGCATPPGLCGFAGPTPETNEVETSPIVAGDQLFFGMDVNENGITGKGGFYSVDVHDGHLLWFFDEETGATCSTLPGDDVRRFDGYHSESELGLVPGFLATRPGCGFDRSSTGCTGIWASAAVDAQRQVLFFGTSACTEGLNATAYEEAIVALHFDGTPAWHWKPRPEDANDLDFGATPNLFTITVNDVPHDVLGAGGKDGTYYVLDRDGVNGATGVRWDDADPSELPYWHTHLVNGDGDGGIIGTSAVDEATRRVYVSTAPGDDVLNPSRPTVHALDADTGAIVWQNTTEVNADASFAPTSAIPGVVFVGQVLGAAVRAYDASTGERLGVFALPGSITLAAAPAIVDGTLIVGGGAGERSDDPNDQGNIVSHAPTNVTALCAAGTPGCDPLPDDRCDEGGSAPHDAAALAQVRAAVEASCACASFDGTGGHRHENYVHCAQRVLRAAVRAGALRRQCQQRAAQTARLSTCGRPSAVVCCETAPANRCLVTAADACTSADRRVRTSCAGAVSCDATACSSAGVCEAGG